MATKLQLITAMYEHQTKKNADVTEWTRFLRSASRNYKLTFDEQLLVHAQRPDATAVLELDKWNRMFGRWVNKGAAGIAVFDRESRGKPRLKYYFDISDTHDSQFSRPIPLWEMTPANEADVIETLEATFGGLSETESLAHAIISAADNAVTDNITDYLSELVWSREDSFLEELDDLNVEVAYSTLLKNSLAFMWLSRCGIDPFLYLDDDDFRGIYGFNTRRTFNLLGTATSAIAEMGLREISSTVLNLQRAERDQNHTFASGRSIGDNDTINHERGVDDGRADLHRGEWIQNTQPDPAGGSGRDYGTGRWQIRPQTQDVSAKPQAGAVHRPADDLHTEPTPGGVRADGAEPYGADGTADGGGARRDRGTQSPRSDAVGGPDEQHPSGGGGSDSERTDLQLNLPTPEEQQTLIEEAEVTANADQTTAFSLPQIELDNEILLGSGFENGKYRIYEYFTQSHTTQEKAAFLKKEFGTGGHSPFGVSEYSVDHDANGLHFRKRGQHDKITVSWSKVARRIGALVESEAYLNEQEQSEYPQWLEQQQELRQQRAEEAVAREILRREPEPAAEYRYRLDDTVYIGNHEYEVLAFDKNTVRLYDTEFPMLNAEMSREEFDRKVAENPLNVHLLVDVGPTEPEKAAIQLVQVGDFFEAYNEDAHILADIFGFTIFERGWRDVVGFPSSKLDENLDALVNTHGYTVNVSHEELEKLADPEPYTPIAGDRYEIQGRQFVVESVSEDLNSVSLQDITFQQNAGFPIFRKESLDFIRMYDPIHPGEPEQAVQGPESTITPAWAQKKKPVRANYFDAFPNIPMSERHNFKITDDDLGVGGAKAKFRANMDAIHLLHNLELDQRLATPEEQEILSRYVGWGSLPQAFDPDREQWADEFLELQAALSKEAYESARSTTLNAHYTSPVVIKAIYHTFENIGFKTGNILDPGCGIGNFQGLLPDSMSDSKVYGIEIDHITGRIAQQLYQRNSITIQGYEDTPLPDSFFDLAVGNVPFGGYSVADKKYDKHKFLVHDYFFAKTLDKVRPGGVIAFITSKGTMDKANPSVRKYIAQRAELLGAIRLPNNAFLANAGTQVTTDIIFLQKRDRIQDIEPGWIHLSQTESGIPVNQYFADHPDMMLGEMAFDKSMYGNANETTCNPYPDSDLAEQLADAITNIHGEVLEYERDDDVPETEGGLPADPTVRNFSFCLVEGSIYYRENSMMYSRELSATAQSRVKGMVKLRDCVRALIQYQTDDYPGSAIKSKQAELNRLYDNYTKRYGLLNDRANALAFDDDSSYALLCSLEVLDEDRKLKKKADMFTKRTIKPPVVITHCDTATDALAVSLSECAR